jgi:hypothetical protein
MFTCDIKASNSSAWVTQHLPLSLNYFDTLGINF